MILVWIVSIDIYLLTDLPFSLLSIPTNISAGASGQFLAPQLQMYSSLPLLWLERWTEWMWLRRLRRCSVLSAERTEQTVRKRQCSLPVHKVPSLPAFASCWSPVFGSCSLHSFSPVPCSPALRAPQHPSRWCHSGVLLVSTSSLTTTPSPLVA